MQENLSSLLTSAAALTLVVVGLVQGIRAKVGIDGGWQVLLLACGVGAVVGVGAALGLPDVSTIAGERASVAWRSRIHASHVCGPSSSASVGGAMGKPTSIGCHDSTSFCGKAQGSRRLCAMP